MSRRTGLYLSYLLLAAACVYGAGCDGCSGAPTGFNKVTLSTANSTVLQGGTTLITASVADDPNAAGVSWTLTGAGSVSGATKTTVTYTAPASVTAETVVTVHASAVDFPSQASSIQITLEPPVSITTTTLPGGNYGSPYSQNVSALGGIPPFTWSISAGSLTSGLSLGSSNTRSVAIAGTPTQQINSAFTIKVQDSTGGVATQSLTIAIGAPLPLSVTTNSLPAGSVNVAYPNTTLQATGGVPPFNWVILSGSFPPGLNLASDGTISGTPLTAGTFTFKVQVNDSENPAKTATANLSISIGNLALVKGNYAFAFNGFTLAGNAISVAGSFTADGAGNLTSGVEDVNAVGAQPKNQTFTGTYALGNDNRGTLTFSSLSGAPAYSFSINADGSHGRLIEFDSSGTQGSGDLELRSVSTCTATTFNGNYAFGLVGQQIAVTGVSAAGPDVVVGSFNAAGAVPPSASGSIGPGELDASTPVRVTSQDQSVSGKFAATSQSTRCSLMLSSTLQTMNFSVYPISASQSFVVETDAVSTSAPMLTAGTIQKQVGAPFVGAAGSTFTGTSVAALNGKFPSGNTYVPDVGLMVISGTGTTSFTMNAIENQAGSVIPYAATNGNFQQADTYGRLESGIIIPPFAPVFYMIDQNTAYCIGELLSPTSQPNPFFGIVQPQSQGPFPATSIASVYVEGTTSPAGSGVQDAVGLVSLTDTNSTTGTVAGAQDQTTSLASTSAETVAGIYTIANPAGGAGTFSFTEPAITSGAFAIVSPSEVLMITTTAKDANPAIFIFEQ